MILSMPINDLKQILSAEFDPIGLHKAENGIGYLQLDQAQYPLVLKQEKREKR